MTNPARIAVVTGGNRGIGFEICRQLGKQGVHVVLTSRTADSGEKACAELAGDGVTAEAFTLDVRDADGVAALVEHVKSRHGGLDILVNNAGVAMSGFDEEVARVTMNTNVFAPVAIYDQLLPLMRPGGRVVMVSSGMGERSFLSEALAARLDGETTRDGVLAMMREFVDDVAAGTHESKGWPSSAYRMSKIALNKLTEVIGAELDEADDDRGILINAACPGWVRTDMGGPHATRTPAEGAETPVWLALLGEDGPQGGFFRDGKPVSW